MEHKYPHVLLGSMEKSWNSISVNALFSLSRAVKHFHLLFLLPILRLLLETGMT